MKNNIASIQRVMIATALTSGLVTAGIAASAQTTAAPAAPAATNVSISTVDQSAQRKADLEKLNADQRRFEFYKQGTSQ
jgi:phosphate-selective porin